MKRSPWLGSLAAPFVASLGYVAVMMLLPDPTPKGERGLEAAIVALVVFLLPVSYLATFLFGAPVVCILQRYRRLSFWRVVLFAAPLGVVAAACVLFALVAFFDATVQWDKVDWRDVLGVLGGGAIYGSVIGGVFCLLSGPTTLPADSSRPALSTENQAQ